MFFVIYSMLSIVIGGGIAFLAKYLFSFEVTGFTLIILPIGSIILGAIMGSGLPNGMLKNNIKRNAATKLIVFILAIACAAGINFMFYGMTYIDESNEINYKFKGDHISEFVIGDDEEALTYSFYTKLVVENSDYTLSKNYGTRELVSIKKNKTLNWIVYYIEMIGVFLGFIIMPASILGSHEYCDTCKKYMKKKTSFRIVENLDKEKEELLNFIKENKYEEIREFVSTHSIKTEAVTSTYLEGTGFMCQQCSEGAVEIATYSENDKGKYVEDISLKNRYPLKSGLANLFYDGK